MALPTDDDVRERLRSLGERRARLTEDESSLAVEISDALRDAEGLIPRAEAARLIGVHRTTLYRVYLNGNG